MNVGLGVGLIIAGGLLGLLIAFWGWRRLPQPLAFGSLAGCGAIVGAGALLVQEQASGVEWVVTLLALSVLAPLHTRLVFGRPGSAR